MNATMEKVNWSFNVQIISTCTFLSSVLVSAVVSAESSTAEKLLSLPLSVQAVMGEQLAVRGPRANPNHMADAVAPLCHTQACFNDQLGSLGLD